MRNYMLGKTQSQGNAVPFCHKGLKIKQKLTFLIRLTFLWEKYVNAR